MAMLFEFKHGIPWPRLGEEKDGSTREADGVKYFTAAQAAEKSGVSEELLTDGALSTWNDVLPEPATDELVRPQNVDEVELHRRINFPHLTPEEMRFVWDQCERRGLSVRAGQVWVKKTFIASENRFDLKILTKIDGFRVIAMRTGECAGQDAPIVEHADTNRAIRATITVYRFVKGQRCAFVGTAAWDQYAPLGAEGKFWGQAAEIMLSKCAEAIALRKAFPEELGGLYEADEFLRDRGGKGGGAVVPAPVDNADVPAVDDDTPFGIFQFHLQLSEMGVKDEKQRNDLVQQFMKKWPGLREQDEKAFFVRAARECTAKPMRYGIVAVGGAKLG